MPAEGLVGDASRALGSIKALPWEQARRSRALWATAAGVRGWGASAHIYTHAHTRAHRDTLIHIDTEQHHEMIPDEERQQQRLRSFCSHHPTPHPSFTPSMYNTNACTHAYPHAAHSAHNWGLYVSLAWLPTFFSASYDMDLSESALYSVLPYVSGALASAGAG